MSARHLARLRRELTVASQIPYTALLDTHVLATRNGHYLQTIRLSGASFESADAETLNNWHERLNVLWRNIASPEVALWTHLVRRRADTYRQAHFPPGFAADLAARYRERLGGEKLMVNELYLTIVLRPANPAAGLIERFSRRHRNREQAAVDTTEILKTCAKLRDLALASLDRYHPESLGLKPGSPRPRVELLEFLSSLVNADQQAVGLPRAPVNETLPTTRLLFGREAVEYRKVTTTQFGAFLGIKEYPTPTTPGLFNALLSAPYPLVLTQSFTFLSRAAGQGLLQRQQHRLTNAGDLAVSQADELATALDQLASNHFAFGEHHLSLQVLSDDVAGSEPAHLKQQLKTLDDRLAHARTLLADAGLVVAREDLGLEAAFWAQLPANFLYRPRKAAITTRNFAALAPFLNFPSGREGGNHWGDAIAVLATAARSSFHFSLHTSAPGPNGAAHDTGHTFLCGPTGSGKTVLIAFLVSMLTRFGATQIIFDKDRGLEILVRALGGTYQPLKMGEPTGFNPLRLPPTPQNRDFLGLFLRALAGSSPLDPTEAADLTHALNGTLALEPHARRLTRLIEFLDPTDPQGLHARLAPWCHGTGGENAWAFDNEDDLACDLVQGAQTVGFDVTEFLGVESIRTPVSLYLFHLVRQCLDGRRLVCWLDEFWRLLGDPAFAAFAKDGPKTWRKLNAVLCLSTQSPSDVLESPISRTIVEQTPTQIFFPNPQGTAADYVQGFNLTTRELQLIREGLEPKSRRFLVKQAGESVVCELDLKGFTAELAVLSGRAESVRLAERLQAELGPDHWLAAFLAHFTKSPCQGDPA